MMKPRGGAAYLNGQAIHRLPTRQVARQLAILPQRPEAPDGLSVRELVALGRFRTRVFCGTISAEDDAKIDAALQITGMNRPGRSRPGRTFRRPAAACVDRHGPGPGHRTAAAGRADHVSRHGAVDRGAGRAGAAAPPSTGRS